MSNKEILYKEALSKFKDVEPSGEWERKYWSSPNYGDKGEILTLFDIKVLEGCGWENDNLFETCTSYFIKRKKDYIENIN
jgi:hypothetical protein